MTFLLVFVTLLGPSLAKFCPNIKVIDEIEFSKLVGVWWVWESDGMITYTEPHKCHASHFYPKDEKTITVLNNYVYSTGGKQSHVGYTWSITDEDPAAGGNLMISMTLNRMGVKKMPFLVLDTDYTSYLLVHICKDGPHFLSRLKSSLTLLRKLTYTEDELKAINEKVETALKRSGQTREDLGLFHADWYTKDCEEPKFPSAVLSGHDVVIDPAALTATVNGLATHAGHTVNDAVALATDAAKPNADRRVLYERIKQHVEDVKSLSDDVTGISGLQNVNGQK